MTKQKKPADRIEELERALFAAQQALLTEGMQRDALQADNERLREALNVYRNVADPADWSNRPAEAALAATQGR